VIEGSFPGWTPITGAEHGRILVDLARHLETPLPDDAELLGRAIACYPRHQLIRVRLEVAYGVREAYLLYAPGDPVPLDWTSAPIHDLNERALKIDDAGDAEAYLRFFCFTISGDEGRFFIAEQADDLQLRPGEELDDEMAETLRTDLFPIELLPAEEGDEPWQYRFRAPILYGDALFEARFLLDRTGSVEMVDDTPIAAGIPVVEDELGSDRYFVLVRADGPGISPEEFLGRLYSGDPIENLRILGNLDARGAVIEHPVDVSRVTFNGEVTFEGARFNCPVRLDRCTFRGTLDLREVRVASSFVGQRLSVGRNAVGKPGGAAAFLAT
jgi:hypothetical protein